MKTLSQVITELPPQERARVTARGRELVAHALRSPDPALPRWKSTDDRDREALVAFTISELVRQDEELEADRDWGSLIAWTPPQPTFEDRLAAAKVAARYGNLKPLHTMFPALAEFLHEPKRGRGERRPLNWAQAYGRDHTETVRNSITHVRRIWQQHFKHWRRPATDTCLVQILMAYLDLSEAEVRRTMNALNHGR